MGIGAFVLCLVAGIVLLLRNAARALVRVADGEHYRWGVFYVNPEDPRLWVEKRVGVGWTLNYARPAAYWVTAMLMLPVFLALGSKLLP